MDLFEAKNILRNFGYILLKEEYYNIPKDASRIVDFDGMQCYVYTHGYVSEVCHGVKEHDYNSMKEMAKFMAQQIKSDCFIVPAPQHTGKAEYTLTICKLIQQYSNYKVSILDIMGCTPRDTLYNIKKAWQEQTGQKQFNDMKFKSGMYLLNEIDDLDKDVYFVDNVISTGATYEEAKDLIPSIKPLIFAVSRRYIEK